jgi:hypothetical protein
VFSCSHEKLTWPRWEGEHAYQVCLRCGRVRLFDPDRGLGYGEFGLYLSELIASLQRRGTAPRDRQWRPPDDTEVESASQQFLPTNCDASPRLTPPTSFGQYKLHGLWIALRNRCQRWIARRDRAASFIRARSDSDFGRRRGVEINSGSEGAPGHALEEQQSWLASVLDSYQRPNQTSSTQHQGTEPSAPPVVEGRCSAISENWISSALHMIEDEPRPVVAPENVTEERKRAPESHPPSARNSRRASNL